MNKRRCVAYHTKTPGQVKARSEQQKVKNKTPTVRASKKAYNKSVNEFGKNNLHPASIAMENPQWTPKLIFPSQEPSVRRISESMTIPDVHGSPLYIRTSDEVDSDDETPVATAHYSARRQNVTPGQRKSLQNRRNRLFESTIGRKAKGDTPMNASEIEATMSAPMNASCNTPHTQPSVAEDGMPKKRHLSDVSAQTQEPMVEDGNIPDSLFESTIGRKAKGDTHDVMDSRAINNGATEIESTMSAPINASCNTTCTQPSVVEDGMPKKRHPPDVSAQTQEPMVEDDGDEDVVFEEDEEEDEGWLFAGPEEDDDLEDGFDMEDDDMFVPDVPDPFEKVYANVRSETHSLPAEPDCKHCRAKKFWKETPGFCCRGGKIHLPTPDTPLELMKLWTSSDANSRHFRANIRFFNGHFSFTSLYCHLDRVRTNIRNSGVYTFRAHGQIYHNIRGFGKEEGTEPRHLELYFHDDDPSLEHRYRKAHKECEQKDKEVIEELVRVMRGNPYSEQLRPLGQIEQIEDYTIELNLDQWLDQRVYNVPVTSEVAAVWIEGSERRVSLIIAFSSKGKIGLYMV